MLWRNEERSRAASHDCRYCIAHGYQDKKKCLMPELGGCESFEVQLPDFDPDGNRLEDMRTEMCDAERIFELLVEYSETPIRGIRPGANPFVLYNMLFTGRDLICPVGLLDADSGRIIDEVSMCKHYSVLPYEGGLFDQPTEIIEQMKVFAEAEAAFKNDQIENMKNK